MSRFFQWTNEKQRRELVTAIRTELQDSLKRCNEEGLEFVCEDDVERIWTPTRIQILSRGLSWDEQTLQHKAQADFKKILSILIWIHWDDWNDFKKIFLDFPYPRRADDNLPLSESPVGSRYHFSRCQYIFIPIILLEEGRHHTNDPPEYERPFRMPFLESIEIGKGAQGVVTKELVAAKHFQYEHGHPNPEPIWLARKEIERGDNNGPLSRDFRAEQSALHSFKKCLGRHDNIMLSLTTFTHGSHFNIMSPLADLDLRQFLTGDYHDYLERQTRFTPYDLLMEAACLVGALDFLHFRLRLTDKKIACAHLDFKPENVLVIWNPNVHVRSVGQWLVHDFGTARIKEPSEATALAPGDFLAHFSLTKATRNPGPFQAPEVQATKDRVVGRESDMWSFGCMLAVILAFATGGKNYVSGLARSRDSKNDYFYRLEGRKAILKPDLVSWLDDLRNGRQEDAWIERTLDVIYKILVDSPTQRLSALQAQEELDIICSEESLHMQRTCEWTKPEQAILIEDSGLQPVIPPSTHNSMNHRRPAHHVHNNSSSNREFPSHRNFSHQSLQPPPHIQTTPIHHSRNNSDRSNGYPGQNSLARYPSIVRSDTANVQPLYSPTSSSTTYQNFPPRSGPSDESSSFGQSSLTADAAFVHLPAQPKVIKTAVCAISTRVAFLSKSMVSVHNLNFQNNWSPKRPSKPTNGITDRYVAQKIPGPPSGALDMMSLCGDFIVVRAVEGTDYKFLRYQCQLTHFDPTSVELWTPNPFSANNNSMSVSDSINSIARYVLDVAVNVLGDTLFTLDSGLCYFSSRLGFHTLLPTGPQLRRASFSSDGRYVFAWTLGEARLHENRWYIWDASNSTQILNTATKRTPAERLGYGKNGLIFPFTRSFVAFEIPNRVYVVKRDAPHKSATVTRMGNGVEDIVAAATFESTEPQTRAQSLVMVQQKSPPRLVNLQLSADTQNCMPSKAQKLQEGFNAETDGTAIITDFAGTFIVVSHPSGLIERRKMTIKETEHFMKPAGFRKSPSPSIFSSQSDQTLIANDIKPPHPSGIIERRKTNILEGGQFEKLVGFQKARSPSIFSNQSDQTLIANDVKLSVGNSSVGTKPAQSKEPDEVLNTSSKDHDLLHISVGKTNLSTAGLGVESFAGTTKTENEGLKVANAPSKSQGAENTSKQQSLLVEKSNFSVRQADTGTNFTVTERESGAKRDDESSAEPLLKKSSFSMIPEDSLPAVDTPMLDRDNDRTIKQVVKFLLDVTEFSSLCIQAIESKKIGPLKFEKKLLRFIQRFAIGLRRASTSLQERECARFVRSRAVRLASIIRQGFENNTHSKPVENKPPNHDPGSSPERYTSGVADSREQTISPTNTRRANVESGEETSDGNISDASSSISSGEDLEYQPFLKDLSDFKDFMLSSVPFQQIVQNLRDFVNPTFRSSLKSLTETYSRLNNDTPSNTEFYSICNLLQELQTTSASDISFRYSHQNRGLDLVREYLEDMTVQSWDWWPMGPLSQRLAPGLARVYFKCACGDKRGADVPTSFARKLQVLVKQYIEVPGNTHIPPIQGGQASIGPLTSPTSRNGHPVGMSPSSAQLPAATPGSSPTVSSPSHGSTGWTNWQSLKYVVILAVLSGPDVKLAQIDVKPAASDRFFPDMRKRYLELRGPLALWFGIWKYSHCDFFQFEKFDDHEFATRCSGIPPPGDKDYDYRPKPMPNNIPPISPHEFKRRFYTCYKRGLTCRFLHRCKKPCRTSREAVERIPKKLRPLEEGGAHRENFWGILAIEKISALAVAIYHALILTGPFAFWFLWLFKWGHPGDLQNASIPVAVVIGLLSLFWLPLVQK